MSDVKTVKLHAPLFNKFSVGNACSAELDIVFWPKEPVPKMARIVPFVLKNDGTWLKLGVFFTDTRAKIGDTLNIIAYDAMLKADALWTPDQESLFPMSMPNAVNAIAAMMGVEVDSRTVLNSSYMVDYPANEYTLRDVLCYIAGAHGGNWIMTGDGKLLLVPIFGSVPAETNYLVDQNGDTILIGEVRILV